jgi:hypothetical protein
MLFLPALDSFFATGGSGSDGSERTNGAEGAWCLWFLFRCFLTEEEELMLLLWRLIVFRGRGARSEASEECREKLGFTFIGCDLLRCERRGYGLPSFPWSGV